MKNFSRFVFFFVFIMFFQACSKKSELIIEKNKVVGIKTNTGGVYGADISAWKVGDFHAKTISKGMVLKIHLPQLERADLEKLLTESKVDSWLVKIVKVSSTFDKKNIGYIYAPFENINPNTKTVRLESPEAIYVRLYYSPAAFSNRFENLKCPAANFRKLISDFSVDSGHLQRDFYISFSEQLEEKPSKTEIMPPVFDSGMEMVGDYQVEIALYSYKENYRWSEFVEAPGILKIKKEEIIDIPECNDVTPAPNSLESGEKARQFKFGH